MSRPAIIVFSDGNDNENPLVDEAKKVPSVIQAIELKVDESATGPGPQRPGAFRTS